MRFGRENLNIDGHESHRAWADGPSRLPCELWGSVLGKLDASDLLHCAVVSTGWQAVVDGSSRWQQLAAARGLEVPAPASPKQAKRTVQRDLLAGINVARGRYVAREAFPAPEPEEANPGYVTHLAWSPDSTKLAALASDMSVRIFHAASGSVWMSHTAEPAATMDRDPGVQRVWSPDSSRLAVNYEDDGRTLVFNVAARGVDVLLKHPGTPAGMAWFPDSVRLATGWLDGWVYVSDAIGGASTLSVRVIGELGVDRPLELIGFALSPTGHHYGACCDDGTLRLCDAETGLEVLKLTSEPGRFFNDLSWSPDGSKLVSCSDCWVHIVDVASGMVRTFEQQDARGCYWSPDSTKLATSSRGMTIRVTDPMDARELLRICHPTGEIWAAWDPTSTRLSTASDGMARLTDIGTGQTLHSLSFSLQRSGSYVFWDRDATRFAVPYLQDSVGVHIVHVATGSLTFLRRSGVIDSFSWSPDATMMGLCHINKRVCVLDFSPIQDLECR
ncbi:MAG: hypothetical protein EOO40_00660 [Deltaproteobacteria bacterium]|nr:MAG: hypothetical protein EOO40_00660 [Deltaproteobacteria bacterium]